MYTNVLVGEAIEIALRKIYSSNLAPDIPRSAMKSLLKLAVTNVHFKCKGIWYVRSDGLAMGASVAVVLANVWVKSFGHHCKNQNSMKTFPDLTKTGSAKTVTGE